MVRPKDDMRVSGTGGRISKSSLRSSSIRGGRRDRRQQPRTEEIVLELYDDELDALDDFSYKDGFSSAEDLIYALIDAYLEGDPDIQIDRQDRIYFDKSRGRGRLR